MALVERHTVILRWDLNVEFREILFCDWVRRLNLISTLVLHILSVLYRKFLTVVVIVVTIATTLVD